ncbi:MAG: hypothetical protein IKZ13_07930 [Akkermansia sp.]|nr:hypothetical protein [Akkermansia sp.]
MSCDIPVEIGADGVSMALLTSGGVLFWGVSCSSISAVGLTGGTGSTAAGVFSRGGRETESALSGCLVGAPVGKSLAGVGAFVAEVG